MEQDAAYQQARRRVESRIRFYVHAGVFGGVNLLLVLVSLGTAVRYAWFVRAMVGWGVVLLLHGFWVYGFGRAASLKKRMIEKELNREKP